MGFLPKLLKKDNFIMDSLITVYITNYNYGKYIKKAIDSVLNQTFQDFDILIIDDGSSDNSREIIEQYRNKENIRIIYQQNLGLNKTNNVAIKEAKGKYIMRLDADDFLNPAALGIMSAMLEAEPELGLVYPDYFYADEDGNIIGEEYRQNVQREVTMFDLPAHGACTMIRLDYLKKLGGYNESFSCQDGYDLWVKFVTHFKVANVNKPLFYYRKHGNNLTLNENRILSTRRKIKEAFVNDFNFVRPKAIAVIPARNYLINNESWLLTRKNGNTILENIIVKSIDAKNINHVVLTTSDKEILNFAKSKFEHHSGVIIIERPPEYERFGVNLSATYKLIFDRLKELDYDDYEAIVSLAIEFPFITSEIIDDVINTLTIFKADSVIAVKPDNSTYYQHNGHGMQPILDQDKFTKYERNAIYKRYSAVTATTKNNYLKNNNFVSGKISHIVLDQKSAFEIKTNFHWSLYQLLINNHSRF